MIVMLTEHSVFPCYFLHQLSVKPRKWQTTYELKNE